MNPKEFRKNGLTLQEAGKLFFSHRNARLLVPAAATAVAARLAMGKFTKRDAVVLTATIALEPFVEWLVHVNVLHQKPREIAGRTREFFMARDHRLHHMDPRQPDLVFIPKQAVLPAMALIIGSNALLIRKPRAIVTGVATSFTFLAAYEWTHFLIHSSYVPKSALYKKLRRTHQLHHFRNENYWYGIITPVSDKVLGTFPAKDDVPPSPTVKNLGVAEAA